MINKKYLIYFIGDKNLTSHIDAVHAQSPKSDQYTGEIVRKVIDKANASGIISTISRLNMDINRPKSTKNAPAIYEYREIIGKIIKSKGILSNNNKITKKYLHLAIHGMKNDWGKVFEIGTLNGNSCSPEIENWFLRNLEHLSKDFGLNQYFPGNPSKSYHRNGDPNSNYTGYGSNFNTIQIEINRDWRQNQKDKLIQFFCEIILQFDHVFN